FYDRATTDFYKHYPSSAASYLYKRQLLEGADGVRTPAQLAWVLGRPAFHTVLEIRRLAAAGLVETPAPDTDPAPVPPSGAAPTAGPPDIALLRRVRDALEAHL
ncbi:transcriptional regulator, partial [Streptomyces sp. Act-28]